MHMPPPGPRPDSAVVVGAWSTVVGCSMRSSLPASEPGIATPAPGLPASPVCTTNVVGLVKISEPVLPVAPLGMPVRIGLGTSPSAMRITRLSVGVLT